MIYQHKEENERTNQMYFKKAQLRWKVSKGREQEKVYCPEAKV